jgi:hypothetical protein
MKSEREVNLNLVRCLILSLVVLLGICFSALADSDADLAKQTQNPVANLISLPLQSNFNTGVGPEDGLQYILNVQPVVPTSIGQNWNLINRIILPVMYQPMLAPGVGEEWGLGNTVYQGFISPKKAATVTWGIGPVVQVPTSTDDQLFGLSEWGLGPTIVVLVMPGSWVVGSTVYNIWSVESDDINLFL